MGILEVLKASSQLSRLFAVKLSANAADGAFQAALAFSILFNPERHTDPLQVAMGFAVLLLPYSLLGPFAGALLDHWDRRRVLVWVNLLRAVAILGVAAAMWADAPGNLVLLLALLVSGSSRFIASGLSASLPRLVRPNQLVAMNSLFTTAGTGMLGVGMGISVVLRHFFGSGNTGSAATLCSGALIVVATAYLASRFPPAALGPDIPDDAGHTAIHAVARGLGHGAKAIATHHSVAAVLGALGAHRIVFGANTLMLLLMLRHSDIADQMGGDVGGLAVIAAPLAVGTIIAAFTVPMLVARAGRVVTVVSALCVAAGAEFGLLFLTPLQLTISAGLLGWAGQSIKLTGDVAMQSDIPDQRRGQVFAAQDALFNVAFVAAITATAFTIPASGESGVTVAVCVGVYLAAVVFVLIVHPRSKPRGPGAVPSTPAPATPAPLHGPSTT